jgi:hypothetical protein
MKYKIRYDIKTKEGHSFKKDEIVNGTPSTTKGFVDVTPNGTLILTAQKTSKLAFPMQLAEYKAPRPPFANPLPADNIILVDPPISVNPNERKIKMLFSTIGTIGGIYYAYKKKKSASGYLGFAILGLIAGNVVAMVVNKVKRK